MRKSVYVIYIHKSANSIDNYAHALSNIKKHYKHEMLNDEVIFIISNETQATSIYNKIAVDSPGLQNTLVLNAKGIAGMGSDEIYEFVNKYVPSFFDEDIKLISQKDSK